MTCYTDLYTPSPSDEAPRRQTLAITATEEQVTVERRMSAAIITLNLPDQRNPLSVDMMQALSDELKVIAQDADIRVVIIRGEGKIFSSGHNLKEMTDRGIDEQRHIFDVCTEMMQTVQQIPQPVIAQVHGVAAAAGCQLVATCDLAVAADTTLFLTPGVRIGLFCSTPMVALSRNVGRKRAMEMLLTGEPISADTAVEWGLINRSVPAEHLEEEVWKFVEKLAASSPLTMSIGKQAFYQQIDVPQEQAYGLMSETMATNVVTGDAQEGIDAFLSKRQPVWQGK
ncbi:MAG: enoyl-CoA hydratase [Ornithinimicrobium sp.]